MFVGFVARWGAKFVGIAKGGRVSKSLRTSGLEKSLEKILPPPNGAN